MKAPKLKKLILSTAIASATVILLFMSNAFAFTGPTPNHLTFTLPYGVSEATQTVSFSNNNGGSASFFRDIDYPLPDWVSSIIPAVLFVGRWDWSDEIEITVNKGSLAPDVYNGSITWVLNWGPYKEWPTLQLTLIVEGPRYSIFGDVKDYNNNGISGAHIYVDGYNWTDTDGSGHYTIGNLSNGSYAIEVRNAGYDFKSQTVDINGGNVDGVNFYTIFGYVKHGDGTVISGANIKIDGQLFATTQADGSYRIGLPSSTYNVTAEKLDYPFNPFPVTITNTSKNYIHFYTYLIKGRVTRYEGAGLPGIKVNIKQEGLTIDTLTTDGNGNYEKKVPGGTYTIEATNP